MDFNSVIKNYNPIENAVNSVEAFNGLTFDQSKDMFKSCLGTEFPFDVLEAVDGYANRLKDLLNASLDAWICGTAVGDLANTAKTSIVTSANSTIGAYEKLTGTDIGMSLDTSTIENVIKNPDGTTSSSTSTVITIQNDMDNKEITLMDNTITNYYWLKTFDTNYIDSHKNETISSSGNNMVRHWQSLYRSNYATPAGAYTLDDLGADSINIDCKVISSKNGSIKKQTNGTYLVEVDFEVEVTAKNLLRGPNKMQYDGPDVLSPISSAFSHVWRYSREHDTPPTTLQLESEEIKMDNHPGISLKVSPTLHDFNIVSGNDVLPPRMVINFSMLKFNNEWSKFSSTLNPEQQAQVDAAREKSSELKNMALNSLRSQFMTSSVINEAMHDQIDKLVGTNPALAGVDVQNITDALKQTVANNAISLAHGDALTLDKTLMNTIASEVTASSINSGLASLGIDTTISSDCTAELLSGLIELLPDATLENPFGGLSTYINFDAAISFAQGALAQVTALFDQLMNAECMVAINNAFDVCSNDLAVAVGNTLEVASESLKDPASMIDMSKQYL